MFGILYIVLIIFLISIWKVKIVDFGGWGCSIFGLGLGS